MQNALKSNVWQRIWVFENFKIEIWKGGLNNPEFLENWFPTQNLGPYSLISKKLQNSEKDTPESSRMHGSLMNDKEFGTLKLLKVK